MEQTQELPISNNDLYCIKCRSHTENVDTREETITSKGKPRSVIKATCAVCTKKKNRFVKSVKPTEEVVEDIIKPEYVEKTEMASKKVRKTKKSTKNLEKLVQNFIEGLTLTNYQ